MAAAKLGNSFLDAPAQKQKVLVIIPHEDDEINVAGSVMYSYVQKGADVYCVFTTNGDYSFTAEKEYLPMQPGDVYQTYADVSELQRTLILSQKRRLKKDWGNLPNGTGLITNFRIIRE